jgi:hypothetical protein
VPGALWPALTISGAGETNRGGRRSKADDNRATARHARGGCGHCRRCRGATTGDDRQQPVGGASTAASCSGLPVDRCPAILFRMGSKSRETLYGASVLAAAERAAEARKQADRLACEAWNKRMLGFQGPARPSPTLGDALNAGYRYLEVKCLGCNTHQTVALDIVRRPKATPSMSWSATCGARTARRCAAIRTSGAIWWRCVSAKSRRAIRPQRGGPAREIDGAS